MTGAYISPVRIVHNERLMHSSKRRYHDNFSICPACQQPADLDHWNWQCPLQASNIHRCGGIPRDPLQRCLGWPIGHLNDDKILQHLITRREQAILWRLHTTGEVLLLMMKEIAPRRLQLETVTAFGVRASS